MGLVGAIWLLAGHNRPPPLRLPLPPTTQVVGSASQAVSVMNAASYALLEVEAAMRSAEAPDVAR